VALQLLVSDHVNRERLPTFGHSFPALDLSEDVGDPGVGLTGAIEAGVDPRRAGQWILKLMSLASSFNDQAGRLVLVIPDSATLDGSAKKGVAKAQVGGVHGENQVRLHLASDVDKGRAEAVLLAERFVMPLLAQIRPSSIRSSGMLVQPLDSVEQISKSSS